MLYLITGGSGSGKSEFAEDLAVRLRREEGQNLSYIAAMRPSDEECRQRIARHRKQRQKKGFATVECYEQIEQLLSWAGRRDVLLLECMSNLLANEMYAREGRIKKRGKQALESAKIFILEPLLRLAGEVCDLVIVTNEVFSDVRSPDAETECYLELLGYLNRSLAGQADVLAEVVCAIPILQKGELPC